MMQMHVLLKYYELRVICYGMYRWLNRLVGFCQLILPTDTSHQYFIVSPVDYDSICLESSSKQGSFLYVEDDKVCLKETTTDDIKTHFTKHYIN